MTRARDVASNGGMVLINKTDFSAASAVNINNCFSSTYNNYKMIIEVTVGSGTSGGNTWWQSRNGGTTDTSSVYSYNGAINNASTLSSTGEVTQPQGFVSRSAIETNSWASTTMEIFKPYLASYTTVISSGAGVAGGNDGWSSTQSRRRTASSHDGITIKFDTTSTGTLYIYGYKI